MTRANLLVRKTLMLALVIAIPAAAQPV